MSQILTVIGLLGSKLWVARNGVSINTPSTGFHGSIHNIWSYIIIKLNMCIMYFPHSLDKQRFLTPGHQGWNDLHSLCRIGMEYYLLNNDDNNIIYWIMMMMMMMMMMIMIIMMTMMIIGTATIMIIIITTTLTMTIMKMMMIKQLRLHASHCIRIGVFKTKLPGIIDIIETMSC